MKKLRFFGKGKGYELQHLLGKKTMFVKDFRKTTSVKYNPATV